MKVSKEIMKGTPPAGARRGERTAGSRETAAVHDKQGKKDRKERKEGRKKKRKNITASLAATTSSLTINHVLRTPRRKQIRGGEHQKVAAAAAEKRNIFFLFFCTCTFLKISE